MMKRGTRTMRTALLATSLALLWGAAASAENYGDRMTRGKLQADLGDHQAALQEFDAIAAAEGAPASLRGEARVRLGLAKRALGDEAGSAEAFEEAMARHGTDREVLWLLVQAVGRAVPSRERWEQIWREVRVEVDKKDPAHPRVTAVWPARVRPGAPPASIPSQVHTGQPITLDLKDGDLQEVFRLFADVTQLNVVVNPAIQGAVTIRVSDAPWDEALEQILAVNGYTYRMEGNVLTIARPGDLPPPRTYTGRVIDVDLRDEPLESAFRQIARQGGMDVEIGPRVGGRLSLVLKSVRWDQAFDIVARVNGLTWTRKNGVLRVAHPGS